MLTSNKQDKHDWKWRKHIHILIYYSSLFPVFPHWSYLWLKIQNPHWPSSKPPPPPLQLQISFASNMYFTLRSIETWCRQLLRPLLKEQKKKKYCILSSQSDCTFYNSNANNHKSVKAPWILFTYILVDLLSSVIHGNKIHIFTITITMLGGKIIISFISVDSVWLYCRIFPGIHNVSWIAATIGPALVWNI